jgi:hypothetical protein
MASGSSGTTILTIDPAVLFCSNVSRANRNLPTYSLAMMRPLD